eukprot:TRINITY_DN13305_c0_g1_i2.p2 TRINITY_DN13305_c0_g1~~TRINITY_DN13305_c0_g1_i2.p2  ORF type:complete len:116 (-),score=25.80 TRINITY_DN13305_c0_g1_i2:920-1267(-)
MSNVVGGSSGYGGSGYGNSGYGNSYSGMGGYGKEEKKKHDNSSTYNYGNSIGHYGDYSYGKSTLDKYKDAKNDKPSATSSSNNQKEERKQPEMNVETKKPFEKKAGKLMKPGEKR